MASGPRPAFDVVAPYLFNFGPSVTYVGDGEVARIVKICHNLYLGIMFEGLAEVTLLDLPPRLARALLRVARAQVADPEATTPEVVTLSQRELGNIVGATRESVNKCLRVWQLNKIVEVQNAGIRILDQTALESLADLLDH